MNRLLYISKIDFAKPANLTFKDKIYGQIDGFTKNGFQCDLIYKEDSIILLKSQDKSIEIVSKNKLQYIFYLYISIYWSTIQKNEYDFVYIRHWFMSPIFLISLALLKTRNPKCKIYMEIPTYPYDSIIDTTNIAGKFTLWGDKITRTFYHFYVDKIITFTDYKTIYKIPTINITNGVNSKHFYPLNNSLFDGTILKLVAVANIQSWHGYDRMIIGLKNYINSAHNVKIHIYIIGDGPELKKLKTLVEETKTSDHVTFFGRLHGTQLQNVLDKSHVGIGSLGLHRIESDTGQISTLKSRQYAAAGLPFIKAHKDREIDDVFEFQYTYPNDNSPLDLHKLVNFYKIIALNPTFNKTIHTYAKTHFSWETILKKVVKQYID